MQPRNGKHFIRRDFTPGLFLQILKSDRDHSCSVIIDLNNIELAFYALTYV